MSIIKSFIKKICQTSYVYLESNTAWTNRNAGRRICILIGSREEQAWVLNNRRRCYLSQDSQMERTCLNPTKISLQLDIDIWMSITLHLYEQQDCFIEIHTWKLRKTLKYLVIYGWIRGLLIYLKVFYFKIYLRYENLRWAHRNIECRNYTLRTTQLSAELLWLKIK